MRRRRQVGARADAVLGRAAPLLARGDVALVAHGHLLRVLTARWLGPGASGGPVLPARHRHAQPAGLRARRARDQRVERAAGRSRRRCRATWEAGGMTTPFPEPTKPVASRAEVFLGYLAVLPLTAGQQAGVAARRGAAQQQAPVRLDAPELIKHLRYVELRWLEWGFEGHEVGDPWADQRTVAGMSPPAETLAGAGRRLARAGGAHQGDRRRPTTWLTLASPVSGGKARIRARWSGCSSTSCRSTPATSASSTSSASSLAARSASSPRGPLATHGVS